MQNFQLGLSDAKFLYDLQDQSDNYCLLNSLLNFEDNPLKDHEVVAENVTDNDNMEWLDLVDYKEEPAYDDERSNPEKESERKRKHNQIEKARRLFIDAKIRELGFLLPKLNEAYHELAKDIKYNKGGILKAAVSYLRILKSDQIKKQKFEDKCRVQELQKRKLIMKIQEYEKEMKSYGISVTEFSFQDLADIKDIKSLDPKHFKPEKNETRKTFEQLDDLTDDDMHLVTTNDPMFSSLECELSPSSTTSSKLSRSSSTESTEDSDSMIYQQKKLQKKEKKKVKRHTTTSKPRPELYNTPRIPVVSRPYHFKARFNLSLPSDPPRPSPSVFNPSSATSMVFPLPQGLNQLTDSISTIENEKSVKSGRDTVSPDRSAVAGHLSRSLSSSSEDEQHWSNVMFDKKVKSDSTLLSTSPPPRPSSVIKKTASALQTEPVVEVDMAEMKPAKRKVILQERGF